ncbi:unnamed protein product [Meloidogyne enterolobii]|uniref:Uncharacterized protein n=1 Tax=Meloidogyne enterolobii TaxID=390850 RepID=A0ACB0YN74_MELEN
MGLKGSKPKLSKEDLEFLKKNTNFTEEQIKEWYKGFVQDCPKGHLTKEQFIKVYKDFFPSGSAEGFCEHVFRTFDTDNSGFIDFKEFLLAINVTSSGTPEQKLEWAFRMYDIDGNGTIDEKEMIKIIEAIYEMLGPEVTKSADDSPRKRAKMIFEKMDINNDKELTLKEFVDGCLADKELFQVGRSFISSKLYWTETCVRESRQDTLYLRNNYKIKSKWPLLDTPFKLYFLVV